MLTPDAALGFVRDNGVVLVSAKGPVPTLTEAIVGAPIRGSWWGHPDGRKIYRILQSVTASDEVLACRLVDGKVTLVHKRLWPALVRLADRFSPKRTARLVDEHTPAGRHLTHETPLLEWVPQEIKREAEHLTAAQALQTLGQWALRLKS
jgi:hypothetical protein